MNALFTTAMTLREAGSGVYDGELDKRWTIGPKVHGGAMLALCANAARTACAG
ncbi:thioesterase family protein, partial [Mycobacterium avium]